MMFKKKGKKICRGKWGWMAWKEENEEDRKKQN
jgi:hypothetical protein